MFVCIARPYPSQAPFRRLALLTNIRLGWKRLPVTKTLAYYEHSSITDAKKFYKIGHRTITKRDTTSTKRQRRASSTEKATLTKTTFQKTTKSRGVSLSDSWATFWKWQLDKRRSRTSKTNRRPTSFSNSSAEKRRTAKTPKSKTCRTKFGALRRRRRRFDVSFDVHRFKSRRKKCQSRDPKRRSMRSVKKVRKVRKKKVRKRSDWKGRKV